MRFDVDPEPLAAGDDEILAMLGDLPVPPMLASVAHLTGDDSLLRDDLRPDLANALAPNAGYSAEQIAEAQRLTAHALGRYRDGGSRPAAAADRDRVRRLVDFTAGAHVEDGELELFEAELALDGVDRRRPEWTVESLSAGRTFAVGIIGAGMSGIIAAHRLHQAGVEVTLFEKNGDVGGTWLENVYPGCRVDIQNHFYSYSVAQTSDWPQFYSRQPVLLDYFRACVDRFGLGDRVRLFTEVVEARWDDVDQSWDLLTRSRDGMTDHHRFDALVSATGQLNRPALPDIPGRDRFAGPHFHSASWDKGVELQDRRVVVIGTGASAVQFVPTVAESASHLTVFQRTPPWLLPVPNYEDDVPPTMRAFLCHVPQYARWDRLWILARTQEGLLPLASVDPDWNGHPDAVSAENDMLRELLTMYYDLAFPDPELRAKMLPHYPPVAKRVVLDGGRYPAALARDDVDVETCPIEEITPTGVLTVDGVHHPADVLIYATGFQASRFLTPMRVFGCGGRDLHEGWGGDARAYLGITVPGFPNLFLMYGPNTNIVINGSITYFSECEATYITGAVRMLLEQGARSMDCRVDVHDRYNVDIDAGNRQRAWGVSTVNTWYRNEHGRIAQNWPFNLVRYWRQTLRPDPADYRLE
jgi:4-hydroxyacetophenone monooxygenase